MDISALVSEYGAYYVKGSQNAQRIRKQLYYQNDFDALFTTIQSDDTRLQFASASMSRLIQPFQKTWSPTGEVTFVPQPIDLYKLKVDFQDYPDELSFSWLGFLENNDLKPENFPFVRWLIEEHIIPQSQQDIILNEAYAGEYAAPGTPGTAGAAGTAMNGVKKIINDHIAAGSIAPLTIGAWDTVPTDFVTQLEDDFVKALPARYQNAPMKLVMSVALANRFRQGQLEKYNMYYQQANLNQFMLFPNIEVVGTEALGSSEKVWATPVGNAICAWKHGSNAGMFEIEGQDRLVKIFTDFYKGYGFIIPQMVFTNDLELPA